MNAMTSNFAGSRKALTPGGYMRERREAAGRSIDQVAKLITRREHERPYTRRALQAWDPLESTCRHASLSIL